MQSTKIHKLDAYAYLEAAVIIQLSCCIRHGLSKEWDDDKLQVLRDSFNVRVGWRERLIAYGKTECMEKPDALWLAINKLPSQFYEAVFMSCARIVAMKGYDKDLEILKDIKVLMGLEEDRATVLIDAVKAEAALWRLSGIL